MKRKTAAALAAILLLTGCAKTENSTDSSTPANSSNTESAPPATETQSEPQPEITPENSQPESAETTEQPTEETPAEQELIDLTKWIEEVGYYPAMPAGDEAAMQDTALVEKLREAAIRANRLDNMMYGCCYVVFDETMEICEEVPAAEAAYYYVGETIPDEAALVALYKEAFSENYLSSMEIPLDEQLFGDSFPYRNPDTSEIEYLPYYKMVDGKLAALGTYAGVPMRYDYDNMIVTYYDGDIAEIVAAGTCLSVDNWSLIKMSLKKSGEDFVCDWIGEFPNANCMGKSLQILLSEENLNTLSLACGCNTIKENGDCTLIDNTFYEETEQNVPREDLVECIESMFSKELSEYYISYMDSIYVWKNGVMYINEEANSLDFGSYYVMDSLCRSLTSYSTNNLIPWFDSFGNSQQVYVTTNYYKITSPLPANMKAITSLGVG